MTQTGPIITIDGPAGVGKSTISKALASTLHYAYIDTGAMFRAVALAAHQASVSWEDANALAQLLPSLTITFRQVDGQNHLFLDQTDVETQLRTPEISRGASLVSKHSSVRTHLLELQRNLGAQGNAILEGRDTGSVVFPNAEFKFYLDASPLERATRRHKQMGSPQNPSIAQLQAEIEARDLADQQREIAPLLCPQDALRIDTSALSFSQVLQQMLQYIQKPPSSPPHP